MRAPNNKRARGRSNRRAPNPNRSYESHGADVKIRGNASQVYEKYCSLARDASSSGDPISAEGYWQHAEHYFRILQLQQSNQQNSQQNNQQNNRSSQSNRDSGSGQDEQPKQDVQDDAAAVVTPNEGAATGADDDVQPVDTPADAREQSVDADAPQPVVEDDNAGVERAVRRGRPRRAPRRTAAKPSPAAAEDAPQPVAEVESAAE